MKEFSHTTSAEVQPSLDYYPALLRNALFVIGGMTSMVIESLIFRKKFIGLIHVEKNSITSPHIVYSRYLHFKGVKDLPNVFLCTDLKNLSSLFLSIFNNYETKNQEENDMRLNFFHHYDNLSYDERLNNIIKHIKNKTTVKPNNS